MLPPVLLIFVAFPLCLRLARGSYGTSCVPRAFALLQATLSEIVV